MQLLVCQMLAKLCKSNIPQTKTQVTEGSSATGRTKTSIWGFLQPQKQFNKTLEVLP